MIELAVTNPGGNTFLDHSARRSGAGTPPARKSIRRTGSTGAHFPAFSLRIPLFSTGHINARRQRARTRRDSSQRIFPEAKKQKTRSKDTKIGYIRRAECCCRKQDTAHSNRKLSCFLFTNRCCLAPVPPLPPGVLLPMTLVEETETGSPWGAGGHSSRAAGRILDGDGELGGGDRGRGATAGRADGA